MQSWLDMIKHFPGQDKWAVNPDFFFKALPALPMGRTGFTQSKGKTCSTSYVGNTCVEMKRC